MRKSVFKISLLLLLSLAICWPAFAAVGIWNNGKLIGAATDLDFSGGDVQTDNGSLYHVGNSVATEIATSVTAIPVNYAVVPVTITSRTCYIPAGYPGQVITIMGIHRTSGTLTIRASCNTVGWTYATMATNGYTLTLMYLDDPHGWLVVHYYGTTVA